MRKERLKNYLFWLMGLCAVFRSTKKPLPFINIVGDLFSESGLGSVTRQIIASIDGQFEYQVINMPLSQHSRQQPSETIAHQGACLQSGITIFIGNPEILRKAFIRLNPWRVINNYTIGVWFWELEKLPQPWRYIAPLVDEVWAQSHFIQTVFQQYSPRVRVMPFSLDTVLPSRKTRADFGLDESQFIFLFTFDYLSHATRKNPEAVIACFRSAFKDSKEVLLIIKTVNSQRADRSAINLKRLSEGSQNIIFFDEYYEYADLLRLIQLANCYVSLHRSEGLGLGLAEAMKLGTLVIGTDYSGNTDFMNTSNALMVNYTLIPVQAHDYPYGNKNLWAEPNRQKAIEQMQFAFSHADECYQLVTQASLSLERYTSKHQGAWIENRIREIS